MRRKVSLLTFIFLSFFLLTMSLGGAPGPMRDSIVEALNAAHARARAAMDRQRNGGEDAPVEDEEVPAPPDWAKEMRVKGIVYIIAVEKAQDLWWQLAAPMVGEGNNKYVCVVPAMENVHTYLQLADLGPDFSSVTLEGYDVEVVARILACTAGGVEQFLED